MLVQSNLNIIPLIRLIITFTPLISLRIDSAAITTLFAFLLDRERIPESLKHVSHPGRTPVVEMFEALFNRADPVVQIVLLFVLPLQQAPHGDTLVHQVGGHLYVDVVHAV